MPMSREETGTEAEPAALDELVGLQARMARIVRRDAPKILEAACCGKTDYRNWGNYAYLQAAYLPGYAYYLRHPANDLRGQTWCAELAVDMMDALVDSWRRAHEKGERVNTSEWPIFVALEFLGACPSWVATRGLRSPEAQTGR